MADNHDTNAALAEAGIYEVPPFNVLRRLEEERTLVTIYTQTGWYTGWITSFTPIDVTLKVRMYVDAGMEIPYVVFPRPSINSLVVVTPRDLLEEPVREPANEKPTVLTPWQRCRSEGHNWGEGPSVRRTLAEGETQTCVVCGVQRSLHAGRTSYRY